MSCMIILLNARGDIWIPCSFETILHCEPPRVRCKEHGVKTIALPWASKHSRFTQLFEAFSIEVIQASRSLTDAQKLLRLSWDQVHLIMKRAVDRDFNDENIKKFHG